MQKRRARGHNSGVAIVFALGIGLSITAVAAAAALQLIFRARCAASASGGAHTGGGGTPRRPDASSCRSKNGEKLLTMSSVSSDGNPCSKPSRKGYALSTATNWGVCKDTHKTPRESTKTYEARCGRFYFASMIRRALPSSAMLCTLSCPPPIENWSSAARYCYRLCCREQKTAQSTPPICRSWKQRSRHHSSVRVLGWRSPAQPPSPPSLPTWCNLPKHSASSCWTPCAPSCPCCLQRLPTAVPPTEPATGSPARGVGGLAARRSRRLDTYPLLTRCRLRGSSFFCRRTQCTIQRQATARWVFGEVVNVHASRGSPPPHTYNIDACRA